MRPGIKFLLGMDVLEVRDAAFVFGDVERYVDEGFERGIDEATSYGWI